jgi:hypothetical protein
MKRILLILIITIAAFTDNYSQSIGIRAGLNYSQFNGPTVAASNEKYSFGSGFHFGINYNQLITDDSYLRFELLYIQNGTKYELNGDSYYYIRTIDGNFYEKGNSEINLNISNAYLSLPVTYHYSLTKKIELHAGAYFNFLIGPRATGVLRFVSEANPDDIRMKQSLDYNYGSDLAGGGSTPDVTRYPTIIVGDDNVVLPSYTGAYYQYQQKDGNRFSWFDAGVSVGGAYYFNRGFYGAARLDYGLTDLTRTKGDISITDVDVETNTAANKTTKDSHIGIQVSLGFKF